MLDQRALLGLGERLADPHPDGADALRSMKGRHDVEIVRQAGRHPVAGTNAASPQRSGGRIGGRVELAIGQRAGTRDHGGRIGTSGQRLIEDVRDRRAA